MSLNNFVLIGWLYLIQGIPYGIQDKFIPLHLHLQNLTFTNVSLMKSLLFPWICKGLWAPFIQVYLGPYFWLLISVAGLSIISLIGSFVSPSNVYGIACVLFILNLLSAIQDIVVDGFALSSLRETQLGFGNSLQVVLYKFGSLVGGAGLIYISHLTSWSISYLFLSACYLFSVVIILIQKEVFQDAWTRDEKESKEKLCEHFSSETNKASDVNIELKKNEIANIGNAPQFSSVRRVFQILRDVIKTPRIVDVSVYVAIYKMGERGAINNFPLYLLDQGVTPSQLAFWNGIVCQCLSILGSALGGYKLSSTSREKTNSLLRSYITQRSLAIFCFYFIIQYWKVNSSDSASVSSLFYYASMFSLVYLNFTSGVISTATFTWMMEESKKVSKGSQATHYSCLSSIEVAGKLIFATFAGVIIDLFNIKRSFILFFILSLLPYYLVRRMKS